MRKAMITLVHCVLLLFTVTMLANAQEQITLRFMSGYVATQPAVYGIVTKMIKEYERLNPHIKIIDLGAEANGDALLLKTLSQEPPDIIKTDLTVLTSFNTMGILETVPDRLADTLRKSYYPVAVQSLIFDGKLKGVPLGGNVTGLIYNKRLFKESGVSEPPASWAELDVIGPKLARWDANTLVRPAIGENGSWFLDYALTTTVFGEGGRLSDDQGNIIVNTPAVYTAVDLWVNAISRMKYMSLGISKFNSAFLNGEVPIWWAEPYYAQTLKARGIYADMAATSPLRGSVTGGAVYRNHGYAVTKSAIHKEEAWKLLEWLAIGDLEGGTPLGQLDAANACIPMARKDVTAPYYRDLTNFHSGFMKAVEIATTNKVWLAQGFTPAPLSAALKEITQKGVSPQQAIANAHTQMETMVANYKKK